MGRDLGGQVSDLRTGLLSIEVRVLFDGVNLFGALHRLLESLSLVAPFRLLLVGFVALGLSGLIQLHAAGHVYGLWLDGRSSLNSCLVLPPSSLCVSMGLSISCGKCTDFFRCRTAFSSFISTACEVCGRLSV